MCLISAADLGAIKSPEDGVEGFDPRVSQTVTKSVLIGLVPMPEFTLRLLDLMQL